MAIDKDLFSSNNFESTIINYCNRIGGRISNINASSAVIQFNMDSGSTQTVFIMRDDDTTLEFSCVSRVKFDNLDDMPHLLSSYLLKKNSQFIIGFWSIEEMNGKQVYSLLHNSHISLIDFNYFVSIVKSLINNCDKFEQAAEQALN